MTRTHTTQTAGEAGLIELDIDFPDVCTQGIAFLAHPITTQGGSKDHKVITTMAKALVSGGWLVVRPNCRGAGRSEGEYNAGPGEAADFLRVIDAVFEMREVAEALPVGGRAVFGGFSFGTYVMSLAAQIRKPAAMIYAGPAVHKFDLVHPGCPAFVVHAQNDELAPLNTVLSWANLNNLTVDVIPATNHVFAKKLPQLSRVFSQFVALL